MTTTVELRGALHGPETSFDRKGESPFNAAMSHLRYAGLSLDLQRRALEALVRADPLLWHALERARDFALPDWLIVSGAVYNTAWNALTGRASGYGLKDIDLFYFDETDLSWEAEDRVIQAGLEHFAGTAVPVEIRNQARVHLWFADRFGLTCPRYSSSAQSLSYFASKTHAVGLCLREDDTLEVTAPFGLDFLFSFRLVGNPALDNRATHLTKGARAKHLWPEVFVETWDGSEGTVARNRLAYARIEHRVRRVD